MNLKKIKVAILAGGFGSRLGEYTQSIPKPLVTIGKDPIIIHIMRIYLKYNISNFYIAVGYKGEELVKFFLRKKNINNKIRYGLKRGLTTNFNIGSKKCKITLLDTGKNTMTGG